MTRKTIELHHVYEIALPGDKVGIMLTYNDAEFLVAGATVDNFLIINLVKIERIENEDDVAVGYCFTFAEEKKDDEQAPENRAEQADGTDDN